MPGEVVEVNDPLYADGQTLIKQNGTKKLVHFKRGPDLTVLCKEGRSLFTQWSHQAAVYSTARYTSQEGT